MLPGIRAAIAVMTAAIGLLAIAFVLVATFRVAQESRASSLQADLAERGRVPPPPHRPVAIVETPAPTLVLFTNPDRMPEPVEASPAPESPIVVAQPAAEEPAPFVMAASTAEREDFTPPIMAFAPPRDETPAPIPAPRPLAIGGPSPEEVAQAQAEHRMERATARRMTAAKTWKRRVRHARARRARLAAFAESRQAPAERSFGIFGIAPGNRQ